MLIYGRGLFLFGNTDTRPNTTFKILFHAFFYAMKTATNYIKEKALSIASTLALSGCILMFISFLLLSFFNFPYYLITFCIGLILVFSSIYFFRVEAIESQKAHQRLLQNIEDLRLFFEMRKKRDEEEARENLLKFLQMVYDWEDEAD